MAKKRHFRIVQPAEHFLYLPLYYAQENGFFGRLPRGYSLTICNGRHETDRSVYLQLMDNSGKRDADIVFAVCDPGVILTEQISNSAAPAVLARLVTNAAFWAVDHKSRAVRFLSDLAHFNRVIAYWPGSTSYAIAQRAFKEAGKEPSIECVDKDKLMSTLVGSPSSWTALSPDLLEVQHLLANDTRFDIDLTIGQTPEYSEFLVTALLSRADVVRDHPGLAQGLVEALQAALLVVGSRDPSVAAPAADCAMRRFQEDEELVTTALNKARESHLFPMNIQVREPDWLNVARVIAEGQGKSFDAVEASRAKDSFARHVEPFQSFAIRATARAIRPAWISVSHVRVVSLLAVGFGLAIAAGILRRNAFSTTSPSIAWLFLVMLLIIAVMPHFFRRTMHEQAILLVHWVFVLLTATPLLAWCLHMLEPAEATAIAAALFGPFVGFWTERLYRLVGPEA